MKKKRNLFESTEIKMPLFIRPGLEIPSEEIEFIYARSSGPGGQNVNKVSSKATLIWNPSKSAVFGSETEAIARMMEQHPSFFTKDGEVVISSQKTRDQPQNRLDCLKKLQTILLQALYRPKNRVPTRPTRGSVHRRLETKARQSKKKNNRRFHDDW